MAAALLALCAVAGVLLWRTVVPPLRLPQLDPAPYFTAAGLARLHRFRHVSRGLLLGSLAAQLLVLALLAWRGRTLAARLPLPTRARVRTGVAVGLLAVVAVWLVTLPVDGVFHWWSARYGLTNQGYAAWLGDEAVALLVRAVLVALAVAIVMTLAGRLGAWWWLVGAPALAGAAVVYVVLQPVVVQPLLTSVHPLRNPALTRELEALARRMGVHVSGVDVENASSQTTAANAEAVGVGPSGRVVLWDTLLDGRFSRAEIRVVAAHEFGHVKRHHVWKGLAWFAVITIPAAAILALVCERARRGGVAHPAVVPLGLLLAFVLFLATLPLQNAVSRRYEAEADWLALEATRDPGAMIALQQGFVRTSLADPHPPAWVTVFFGDHPTTMQRIGMAVAFRKVARAGS